MRATLSNPKTIEAALRYQRYRVWRQRGPASCTPVTHGAIATCWRAMLQHCRPVLARAKALRLRARTRRAATLGPLLALAAHSPCLVPRPHSRPTQRPPRQPQPRPGCPPGPCVTVPSDSVDDALHRTHNSSAPMRRCTSPSRDPCARSLVAPGTIHHKVEKQRRDHKTHSGERRGLYHKV